MTVKVLLNSEWPPRGCFSHFIANVKSPNSKLLFPPTLMPCYDNLQASLAHLISMIISPLWDNDTLLSRWKTPASPAYFKTRPGRHLKCIFSSEAGKKERRLLIETYLACRMSPNPRKWRWITEDSHHSPLKPPVGSRYWHRSHRWGRWHLKGLIRCWEVYSRFTGIHWRVLGDLLKGPRAGEYFT